MLLQLRKKLRAKVILTLVFASVTILQLGQRTALTGQVPTKSSESTERKIVSEDFTRNRKSESPQRSTAEQPLTTKSETPKRQQHRVYTLMSTNVKRTRPVASSQIAQLGVTTWKLRPMTGSDFGATVLVGDSGAAEKWIPVRVHANTKFKGGDFVRLSIESPHPGYLYVIDQDVFADGTKGDPTLIYPWTGLRNGDNWVRPGEIVDIPGQEDRISYFTARPKPNQVGELLTLIVSKQLLKVVISNPPAEIPQAQLLAWEKLWRNETEQFELDGGVGEAWTRQEQLAASRLQQRQLTREDPAPQTIYRVKTSNKSGYLINVRLEYTR